MWLLFFVLFFNVKEGVLENACFKQLFTPPPSGLDVKNLEIKNIEIADYTEYSISTYIEEGWQWLLFVTTAWTSSEYQNVTTNWIPLNKDFITIMMGSKTKLYFCTSILNYGSGSFAGAGYLNIDKNGNILFSRRSYSSGNNHQITNIYVVK